LITTNQSILLAFLCTASVSALGAAATPATPAAEKAESGTLEVIVVTAQKRVENIQNVPIAVTAISGASIENRQITNIQGLQNSMPNVQINSFSNSPDSAVFTIRGVGVNDADPYVGTTVSVVVDGVPVGVNTSALATLFDIDRVEVLRGPQGTLFGANTTGGVVNVVTKQPTGQYGGQVQVVGGNFGRLDANASLNFPISESLAGKISVLHSGMDGYFRNIVDGGKLGRQDMTDVRSYLKFQNGGYNATLIAEYDRSRNGSQTNVNYSDASQLIYVKGFTDAQPMFVRGQSLDQPDQNYRDTYSVTLTQNFPSVLGDVTSITNYRRYDSDLYSDDDAIAAVSLQTRRISGQHQASEELRATLQANDKLNVTYGLFGFTQQYFLKQFGKLYGFVPAGVYFNQPQNQFQKNWSVSAFSQAYYKFTDALQLQVGLRYQHEKTSAVSDTAACISAAADQFCEAPVDTRLIASGDKDWNNIGYKIGLDDQITNDVMVYGYYARGFKSGGFAGRITLAEDIGPFNPEHLDTFEVGVKSDMLDRRLRANLAVFYNLYKDMQVTQNITYLNGQNSASIHNAGRAKTKGFELELTAVPVENLTLSAYAAFLDAKYTEYNTLHLNGTTGLLESISYAGNDLMNAPRWSGGASISYAIPMGPGKTTAFLQDNYTGSKYTNFDDLPQELVGSINLLSANLTWTPNDDRWSVGIYGRNLANKLYYGQKLYLAGVFAIASLGPPREYGVDFKYKW
jgi:iron complex outermembrane receptor protein